MRLQLAEVRAPAGDDAPQVRPTWRRRPAPRRASGSPSRTAPGPTTRRVVLGASRAVTPVAAGAHVARRRSGTTWTLSRRQLEAATTSFDHGPRAGDTRSRLEGEPPLDAVDGGGLSRRARGPRGGRARWRGWWRRRARRIGVAQVSPAQAPSQSWACTTSGSPAAEGGRRAARACGWPSSSGEEVVVGQPRQVDVWPAARARPRPRSRRATSGWWRREHDDFVAGPGQCAVERPWTWAARPPTTSGGYSQLTIAMRMSGRPYPGAVGCFGGGSRH